TETMRTVAAFAPGTTLAMTFLLPIELVDPPDRPGLELAQRGAQASGTPFISFYAPDDLLTIARQAGFGDVQHVSGTSLGVRYFAGRPDGLRPSSGEDVLVATN